MQAKQIRQLKGTETVIETAARYGVTESNIRLIQDGKTWKLVGRKYRHALTSEQIRHIKLIGLTKSVREIAQIFGVDKATIYRVRNNKTASARQEINP